MRLKDSWARVGQDFVTLGKDLGKSILRTVGVVTSKLDAWIDANTKEEEKAEAPEAEEAEAEAPASEKAEGIAVLDPAEAEEAEAEEPSAEEAPAKKARRKK